MIKKIVLYSAAALAALSLFVSCNLDGAGIFRTISTSTEIVNSDLATEPVTRILGTDGNTMLIQRRSSVMYADVSAVSPTWSQISLEYKELPTDKALSTPVAEASYIEGQDLLVYASLDPDDAAGSKKNVYTADLSTLSAASISADKVAALASISVIDIFSDGTDAYVVSYDSAADETTIRKVDSASNVTDSGSFVTGLDSPPAMINFVYETALDSDRHFIFAYYDEDTSTYRNFHVDESAYSTPTELTTAALDTDTASPVIGAYGDDSGILYLVTREGVLIKSDDSAVSSFTAVNADSPMALSAGSSISFAPMTKVTKADTDQYILIGGVNAIYSYNISTPAIVPTEFTSDDDFYTNISTTSILDFYDSAANDFEFYAATSNRWIYKIKSESEASVQLL
jgi:hypothetical protein